MRMRRHAYAMIELPLVFTILAILFAILLAVFGHTRARLERESCATNLKQLGRAFLMYSADYDQTLPLVWDGADGAGKLGGWTYYQAVAFPAAGNIDPSKGSVYPYVKNRQTFVCPADRTRQGCSYAVNALLYPNALPSGAHGGTERSSISDAASVFLLAEKRPIDETIGDGCMQPGRDLLTERHRDRAVFAFADGHAKVLDTAQVLYPNPRGSFRYEPR